MSKYSLLIQKDIIDSESPLIHAPVVVFLMDRIIISDARVTMEESKSFDTPKITKNNIYPLKIIHNINLSIKESVK